MAKPPAFTKAFAGCWRIVEMDVWDKDFLDLVETAHLTFKGAADGEIAFGALKGFLDVRYGTRDGSASAEFCRREMMTTTRPRWWMDCPWHCRPPRRALHIHNGDNSGFVCDRTRLLQRPASGSPLPAAVDAANFIR